MDATFFALAFFTVLNPKLYALHLVLIANRRPWLMFIAFLIRGIGLNVTLGLLDVLVFQADAVSSQSSVSAGLELAIGGSCAVGVAVASARPGARTETADSTARQGWAEPTCASLAWLALGIGAPARTPGRRDITALHNLVAATTTTTGPPGCLRLRLHLIQWSPCSSLSPCWSLHVP